MPRCRAPEWGSQAQYQRVVPGPGRPARRLCVSCPAGARGAAGAAPPLRRPPRAAPGGQAGWCEGRPGWAPRGSRRPSRTLGEGGAGVWWCARGEKHACASPARRQLCSPRSSPARGTLAWQHTSHLLLLRLTVLVGPKDARKRQQKGDAGDLQGRSIRAHGGGMRGVLWPHGKRPGSWQLAADNSAGSGYDSPNMQGQPGHPVPPRVCAWDSHLVCALHAAQLCDELIVAAGHPSRCCARASERSESGRAARASSGASGQCGSERVSARDQGRDACAAHGQQRGGELLLFHWFWGVAVQRARSARVAAPARACLYQRTLQQSPSQSGAALQAGPPSAGRPHLANVEAHLVDGPIKMAGRRLLQAAAGGRVAVGALILVQPVQQHVAQHGLSALVRHRQQRGQGAELLALALNFPARLFRVGRTKVHAPAAGRQPGGGGGAGAPGRALRARCAEPDRALPSTCSLCKRSGPRRRRREPQGGRVRMLTVRGAPSGCSSR